MAASDALSPPAHLHSRARLWWEIGIVLALSLGRSAVFSVLALIEALTRAPLGEQQTSINPGAAPSEGWDVAQQLLSAVFAFAPVALAIYFLWEPARSGFAKIGLTFDRFGRNVGGGLLLVLVIGVPGLGLYALGRTLGITVQVDASPLDSSWWTVPLLLLAALRAGLLEEVVMVGYLFDRLRLLGWSTWTIIISTAALRGSYHAYQGFGPLVGNMAMGVVFGWVYARWGRVMPLVVAHVVIDIVAFVGYPLAAAWWPGVFAPPA
ncbi:CPBP family intramembrane metalloprotease [Microbacterium sp. EYE_5]|uniref:CPBP family intramembrane glutamic endopeptidase n=1 Tax=unclassified Microbacterium TaxID=2609290 RepID=UPI0020064446|nr:MULTISPECIES: CPBP family intramembrane glutamic endopeptidase [unclassified Microbacterium]MCK6081056.1 CPBP family intramembrane metalloprotease [Microbacterium sp. EYE_382]MCK6086326.1 CPBP family intramembrane metalloprotease [Microbacterium sp. EYE_384]MCK6124176.1 CPBP family intramembrane metalloprotease [Microbacterium sp. EYE_80]MCK6127085.1 CPBP family intramembrane metalloprotease [Microbacterium sp. EYE_79]MCK6142011.1 CPBP family intramembrane metalloprotease [Microbacterium sp